MQSCERSSKDGHYKTFGETIEKLLETLQLLGECANKHDSLIQYEKEKQ